MKPTTKEVAVTSKKSETSSLPNPTSMTQAEPVILELAKEYLKLVERRRSEEETARFIQIVLTEFHTIATELISVTAERDALREALKSVGVAGNHLGLLIGINHPLHTASYEDGLNHYGAGEDFEIWTAWKLCYLAYAALNSQENKK
jgi:hypothetical protein